MMCKNALQNIWDELPIEKVQKFFDRQPMIMETIIAAEGERTNF